MKWQLPVVAVVIVAAVACSSMQAPPAMLPSELLANADHYDGQRVRVRGYVVVGPGVRSFYDTEAAIGVRHDQCVGLAGPESVFDGGPRVVRRYRTLTGIFRKDYCRPDQMCPYWCNNSVVVLDRRDRPT